jgi:hypothetical protein
MGADKSTTWLQQSAQDRGGDGKGRVGDDVVRPTGEPKVGGISLHDDGRLAESRSK